MNQPLTLAIMIASGYERGESPALQHERLDFLLSSILTPRQGYTFPSNVRILVCDDYSSNSWGQERCSEVCSKYQVDYRVKPGPWKGPCSNYNFAVQCSNTENIAMLGDDQFCTPGWWDYMTYFIDNNPTLKWGMLGWSVIFVDDLIRIGYYKEKKEFYTNRDKAEVLSFNLLPEKVVTSKWCNWDKPGFLGTCSGTAFVIKKSLWEKFGGFFELIFQFDEDYGDNIWNITDYYCINIPTPPILHYGGAAAWPPEKGPSDPRWRVGWEVRPFVPVKFENRGITAAHKISLVPNTILEEVNFKPLVYDPLGEGLILDLGCGTNKRHLKAIGIDIIGKPTTHADVVCNLGFSTLPFPNNSCERVLAHDLLEHIPHTIWTTERGSFKRIQPTVQLFNEVYRVLKPGGIFETNTPVYPHEASFMDPTHSSIWTPTMFKYFSGNYGGFKEAYGHLSQFEIVQEEWDGIHYLVFMKAIK